MEYHSIKSYKIVCKEKQSKVSFYVVDDWKRKKGFQIEKILLVDRLYY